MDLAGCLQLNALSTILSSWPALLTRPHRKKHYQLRTYYNISNALSPMLRGRYYGVLGWCPRRCSWKTLLERVAEIGKSRVQEQQNTRSRKMSGYQYQLHRGATLLVITGGQFDCSVGHCESQLFRPGTQNKSIGASFSSSQSTQCLCRVNPLTSPTILPAIGQGQVIQLMLGHSIRSLR